MVRLAPVAALLLAAYARAEEPAVEEQLPATPLAEKVQLEFVLWPGAEISCPSERVVRHAILSRMKVDPFSPTAKAKLRVNIYRVGPKYQASYDILDRDGHVALANTLPEHENCGVAVEDVGFSVGVHLPMLITGPEASAEEPPVCEAPPVSPSPPPPPSAAKPPPAAKPALPPRFRLDIGPLLSLGTVADIAPGFSVDLGRRWTSFSLLGGARFDFIAKHQTDTATITIYRTLVEVLPCWHLSWHFIKKDMAFVCGVVQVGAMWDHQRTPDIDKSDARLTASIGTRVVFQQIDPASGFGVFGTLGVDVAVVRGQARIGDAIEWQENSVAPMFGGGLVWLLK